MKWFKGLFCNAPKGTLEVGDFTIEYYSDGTLYLLLKNSKDYIFISKTIVRQNEFSRGLLKYLQEFWDKHQCEYIDISLIRYEEDIDELISLYKSPAGTFPQKIHNLEMDQRKFREDIQAQIDLLKEQMMAQNKTINDFINYIKPIIEGINKIQKSMNAIQLKNCDAHEA